MKIPIIKQMRPGENSAICVIHRYLALKAGSFESVRIKVWNRKKEGRFTDLPLFIYSLLLSWFFRLDNWLVSSRHAPLPLPLR